LAREKILLCFLIAVLTFFIAGLLYLLCFKHVDNLGAYSIPSETGLLIPSGFDSHFWIARHFLAATHTRPVAAKAALPIT
jgi:hypothetical protein